MCQFLNKRVEKEFFVVDFWWLGLGLGLNPSPLGLGLGLGLKC